MFYFFSLCAIAGLAQAQSSSRLHGNTSDASTFASYTYDYVIVGGGTAGLTLAARLTEDSGVTVGVIEAGIYQPDEPLINIPFDQGQSVGVPTLDWGFQTTPQPNLNNRVIDTPRGKVLGGSSALNFMTMGRGSSEEYDAWASLGNNGWNWANLLPYFKKSETVTPGEAGLPGTTTVPGTNTYANGKNGPLAVDYNTNATFITHLVAPFTESFLNIGAHATEDPGTGNGTGVFQAARTVDIKTGKRSYSASAYFAPNQGRLNLLVLTGAQATKVVFKTGSNNSLITATGVNFISGGVTYAVNATSEVILSAGPVQSPQLLELSGIGGSDLLKSLGIDVLIENDGVGENLQDHLLLPSDFLLNDNAPPTWDELRNNATFAAQQQAEYAANGSGVYAATSAIFSFHPIQDLASSSEYSDIVNGLDAQIASKVAAGNLSALQANQYSISRNLVSEGKVGQIEIAMGPIGGEITPPEAGKSYITIINFISRPYSRGSIHINSADPTTPPTINPNYFDFDFDLKIMTLGVKLARKIAETEPLKSLIASPNNPPASTTTDAEFEDYVKNGATTVYHLSGTTALAPQNSGGVVDENLLVYGTSNLRVVDAGVIPLLIAAHTQGTVYAVAERAADIIKAAAQAGGGSGGGGPGRP